MQQSLTANPSALTSPLAPDANALGTSEWPASPPVAPVNAPSVAAPASVAQPQFHQATHVNVHVGMPSIQFNAAKSGPSFAVRALWFVAIGWWLSAFFIVAGYALVASMVLLPMGLWVLNRIPQAQTLRPRTRAFSTEFRNDAIVFTEGGKQQIAWYLRLLYLPVGLVLGALWLSVAWLLGVSVVGLPLSIMMVDRAPTVITLQQN